MEHLTKIVSILNDHQYHDGTTLGKQLNITRAAVWKMIHKLRNYGIAIQSMKGKGYLLENPLILLNKKQIKSLLNNKTIQLEIFEKINSTNVYLKENFKKNKVTAVLSETQTAGKGRLGRKWHSPFGENIYLSLAYPIEKDMSELSGLSLMIGLATCAAIESTLQLDFPLYIKWPNDIILCHQKIAGILIDIQAESHGLSNVIIGVGLNTNMKTATSQEINQTWGSLYSLTGQYQNRNLLAAALINQFGIYLNRFLNHGLQDFMREWENRDYLYHQSIHVISHNNKLSGICLGINGQGNLQLKLKSGEITTCSYGDTSIGISA